MAITLKYKPSHLPQVSAPYIYVMDQFKKDGVKTKMGKIDPNELQPSQGLVSLDKISDIDPNNLQPIWTSMDNKVIDGHHRYGCALSHGVDLPFIQIMLPQLEAIRALNKVQDIYEYEEKQRLEEIVAQDQINALNEPEVQDYLSTLQMEMNEIEPPSDGAEKVGKKKRTVKAYRNKPVNDDSPIGNFFSVKPQDGFTKYEIEFDNLLETDKIGLPSNGKDPFIVLTDAWFPNIKFDKIAKKHKVNPNNLRYKAIFEKAMDMGYDGIKYGDIIIQGLK